MENENKTEIEVVKKRKINKKIIIGLFLIVLLFFLSPFLFPQTIIKIDSDYNKWMSERVFKDLELEYGSTDDVEKYVLENSDYFSVYEFSYNDFEKFIDNLTKNIKDEKTICRYNSVFVRLNDNKVDILYYFTPTSVYLNTELVLREESNILCVFQDTFQGVIDSMVGSGCDIDSVQSFMNKLEESDLGIAILLLQMSYKPVIYLYPEEELELEVKLDNVTFTTTYPLYKDAWDIIARRDGTLIDKNNREYNYLYWEGYTDYQVDLSEGFIISKDKYIEFLEDKLEYIGLSDKEACDFISYWLPLMNEYEYCLVSFQKDYGEKVKIAYNIQPDNELILFVAFKGLDKPIKIEEQDLSYYNDFERTGFTVVEWGGTIIE